MCVQVDGGSRPISFRSRFLLCRYDCKVTLDFESVIWAGIPSSYAVPLEAKLSKVDLIVMPVPRGCRTRQPRTRSVRDIILRSASCPILSITETI